MRQRWINRTICSVITVALVIVSTGPVLADTNSIARSALVPGTGQAHQGHYTKAAVFAGAAVVTGVGLLLSQVHYNQSVMRYNDLREIYLGYPGMAQGGTSVFYSDITQTYDDMQTAWDTTEDRKVWRNVFLGAFVVTYALNIVDVILNKPETGERLDDEASIGFQMDGDNVRIYKTFDF
jgi:hypothetical protein